VKQHLLHGFVQHLGQDISSIANASILEHATDEGNEEVELNIPDQTIAAVVANTSVERARATLQGVGEDDSESEVSEVSADDTD